MNTKTKKLKSFKWIVCTLALIVFCVNMIQIPMQKLLPCPLFPPGSGSDPLNAAVTGILGVVVLLYCALCHRGH